MFRADTFEDVFTPDELARAAGVPRYAVVTLLVAGEIRPVSGTRFFTGAEAIRAAASLRATAVITQPPWMPPPLFSLAVRTTAPIGQKRAPFIASSCAHLVLLLVALWLTAGSSESAAMSLAPESAQLVFLMSPGPGGGGGGGGARQRQPPPRLERRTSGRTGVAVPATSRHPVATSRIEPEPTPAAAPERKPSEIEPLVARTVIAPVVVTTSRAPDREGVVARPSPVPPSAGPGEGGSAGSGRGAGNGDGVGAGIGDGNGGGTGGGPYRPGAGIEPPRLLREVKAVYTEDARLRGIGGAVLLEIVVRRDGSVGDVTLRRGLGAGLDREAIAAVRQWTFAPARRLGAPVDVVVEVAVEFTQR